MNVRILRALYYFGVCITTPDVWKLALGEPVKLIRAASGVCDKPAEFKCLVTHVQEPPSSQGGSSTFIVHEHGSQSKGIWEPPAGPCIFHVGT